MTPTSPSCDMDLGQHWLRQWLVACWHQAITWTNVGSSSVRSSHIHLHAISQKIHQPPVTKISLEIIYLQVNSNLSGTNELTRARFNIKMLSYQYRISHWRDKTILRPSYLHNGISYTGKTTPLYWIEAQAADVLWGMDPMHLDKWHHPHLYGH